MFVILLSFLKLVSKSFLIHMLPRRGFLAFMLVMALPSLMKFVITGREAFGWVTFMLWWLSDDAGRNWLSLTFLK